MIKKNQYFKWALIVALAAMSVFSGLIYRSGKKMAEINSNMFLQFQDLQMKKDSLDREYWGLVDVRDSLEAEIVRLKGEQSVIIIEYDKEKKKYTKIKHDAYNSDIKSKLDFLSRYKPQTGRINTSILD